MDPVTALVLAQGGSIIVGSLMEGMNLDDQKASAQMQADFEASQLRIRQGFLEQQAEEVMYLGDKEAQEYRKKVSKFKGMQRAAVASQGISVDSGTAIDLEEETAEQGAMDVLTIKNNAFKEAFGIEQEAMTAGFAAQAAELTGKSQAASLDRAKQTTWLTGGLKSVTAGATTGYRLRK